MRVLVGLAAITIMASVACGDRIVLRNGQTLQGRIVAEDEESITLDAGVPPVSVKQTVDRSDVLRVEKPQSAQRPVFFEMPVMGVIGEEVTAQGFASALEAARDAKATHVVLLFDSPGGQVAEMDLIIEVLGKNRDLNTIALIKNAHSAAAVIASACRTIVMYPTGQTGAAVPYKPGPDGTPQLIDEKLTSAFRARGRTAAALGGHDPLLLMGMIDPTLELYLGKSAQGEPVVHEGKKGGERCIKPAGKILTMTAAEAVEYGWAKAICRTTDDLRKTLEVEAWDSAGEAGWSIMKGHRSGNATLVSQAPAIKDVKEKVIRQSLADAKIDLRKTREDRDKCNQKIKEVTEQLRVLRADFQKDRLRHESKKGVWAVVERDYDRKIKYYESELDYWTERLKRNQEVLDLAKENGVE